MFLAFALTVPDKRTEYFAQCENKLSQPEKPARCAIVVLEHTNALALAATVDPLRAANRQAGRRLYVWQYCALAPGTVALTTGMQVKCSPLSDQQGCDLLLVVAGFHATAQAHPKLLADLRRLARKARFVGAIDGGAWVLAQAGLLDGYRATTHWEDLAVFAEKFPRVRTVNARFVESGSRITSGGAAPTLEMMLHVVALEHGNALASKIAGSFIYDAHSLPDAPQEALGLHGQENALLSRAHAIMSAEMDQPLSVAKLARRLGVSTRSLQMQFHDVLQTTPRAHALALRLAEADRRVRQTDMSLLQIALATGFQSQSSFARAYRRAFGQSARTSRRESMAANRASGEDDAAHLSRQ